MKFFNLNKQNPRSSNYIIKSQFRLKSDMKLDRLKPIVILKNILNDKKICSIYKLNNRINQDTSINNKIVRSNNKIDNNEKISGHIFPNSDEDAAIPKTSEKINNENDSITNIKCYDGLDINDEETRMEFIETNIDHETQNYKSVLNSKKGITLTIIKDKKKNKPINFLEENEKPCSNSIFNSSIKKKDKKINPQSSSKDEPFKQTETITSKINDIQNKNKSKVDQSLTSNNFDRIKSLNKKKEKNIKNLKSDLINKETIDENCTKINKITNKKYSSDNNLFSDNTMKKTSNNRITQKETHLDTNKDDNNQSSRLQASNNEADSEKIGKKTSKLTDNKAIIIKKVSSFSKSTSNVSNVTKSNKKTKAIETEQEKISKNLASVINTNESVLFKIPRVSNSVVESKSNNDSKLTPNSKLTIKSSTKPITFTGIRKETSASNNDKKISTLNYNKNNGNNNIEQGSKAVLPNNLHINEKLNDKKITKKLKTDIIGSNDIKQSNKNSILQEETLQINSTSNKALITSEKLSSRFRYDSSFFIMFNFTNPIPSFIKKIVVKNK
jgi:hypothetical protein